MWSDRFTAFPHEDYLAHRQEIDAAIQRVLLRGQLILGEEVAAFEQEFAFFTGTRHAIGVANGTDAIEVMLRALGIGAGKKVALPSHTAAASASGIIRAGAMPVFVDIDPQTFTMCPSSLDKLLRSAEGKGVRAVLAVHLYGHPVASEELQQVASEHDVVLLEDCAQAHGATYRGRKTGSLGRAAAFSFYPTKNLGAMGDAGAVTTDDAVLAERIRMIRQYGWNQRHISECEGVNSRLDELQAAVLRVKLKTLAARVATRRELAAHYHKRLDGCPHVTTPVVRDGCEHSYHLYVIRSSARDALMTKLTALKIPVALHYPAAIHQQPGYARHASSSSGLPQTNSAVPQIMSLPMHPYLTSTAIEAVCDGIMSFNP